MYLTSVAEVPVPRKDAAPPFRELLSRMDALCNKARFRNHHEMFSLGFLFSKFKLNKFQDFELLYNYFSTLPSLIADGLISMEQKCKILERLVADKTSISLPKPFEMEMNGCIEQCINDKLAGTNTFDRPVVPPKLEEDESEKFIREMLEKESQQQRELEKRNQDAARRLYEEEKNALERQISEESKKPLNMTCPICLEEINFSDLGLLQCRHSFHRNCLCESFKIEIDARKFPIKCPSAECRIECISSDVVEFLPNDYVTKYENYTFERYVDMHNEDMSWCPSAGCKYVFYFNEGDTEFACPICSKVYCLQCKVEFHKGMTCKEFNIGRVFDKNDEKFIEFIKGAKYKQCPKCKFWVEKNEGCDHMTCRCSFEFCYICGGVYQKCACTGAAPVTVFIPGLDRPVNIGGPGGAPRPPGISRPMPMPLPRPRKR